MKRGLLTIILLLVLAAVVAGQDRKVTELPALTSPTSDDLLMIVDTPGGTPASKKITVDNLFKYNGLNVVLFTGPSVARTYTLPDANATLVSSSAPTITGGSHTALTALGIRSTGTGAFDLTFANSENLTAGRTLTIAVNDAARSLTVAGNTTVSGTNTGDQFQSINTARFLGRVTAGTGAAEELTGTQATTLLDAFTSTLKGVAPASGGGTTNFLRADGAWAAPGGGGMSIGGSITSATAGYSLYSGVGGVLAQTISPVNVKGYNASGSSTTTTGSITSGTATLTLAAAIDFANGQGILVAGAGAAGADLVTTISSGAGTTTLTLATNAGTTVSGVLTQHDDTVAIQAAINAVNVPSAGGGTVEFPDGVYRVNGPINVAQGNSILHVLSAGGGGAPDGSVIKLRGLAGHFVGGFTSDSTSGAVLLADRRAGSGTTPSVLYGGSQTTVYVENLTIRTPDNPSLDGLNFFDSFNASLNYVVVDTGTGADVVTEPTNTTSAIRMPKTQNFGMTYLENVLVMGHATGITFSENTVFNNVIVYSCKLALSPLPAVVTSSGHVLIYRCAQLIKGTTGTAYVDLSLSIQNIAAAGNWFSRGGAAGTLKDIDDASNWIHGTIRYSFPGAAVMNRNGATNLSGLLNLDTNTFELLPLTAHSLIAYANTEGQSTFRVNNTNGNAMLQVGSATLEPTRGAIYLGPVTPSASTYTLKADGSTEVALNAPSGGKLSFRVNHGFSAEANWNGTSFGIGVAYDAALTHTLHVAGTGIVTGALKAGPGAIGATSTDGLILQNTTDAAAGAQQWSPRLRFHGEGWKTDATAASQEVDWISELVPVQGAANPSANLVFSSSINGGAYSEAVQFTSLPLGGVRQAPVTFANLGTPANGIFAYCSDCTQTTPGVDNTCAGSGNGAYAFRVNGAWKCVN